jgi:hypothetical protein
MAGASSAGPSRTAIAFVTSRRCWLEVKLTGMSIEDDIRKGAEQARRQKEHEQQQAAEQARQAAQRAERATNLWVYLERYRDAARSKYGLKMIECVTRKLFRREDKIICRDAWLISSHHGGLDNIGQTITYRLWLDNDTCDLWWQHHPHPARRITLGQANPNLSAEENQALERAENDMPGNLGALAERHGVEILAPRE